MANDDREVLERHWRRMRRSAAAAMQQRQRPFSGAIDHKLAKVLRRTAFAALMSADPNWRNLSYRDIALLLNRSRLCDYNGRRFHADTARDLARAIRRDELAAEDRRVANQRKFEEEVSSLATRVRAVIEAMDGPWDSAVEHEAAAISLVLLEERFAKIEKLARGGRVIDQKLKSFSPLWKKLAEENGF